MSIVDDIIDHALNRAQWAQHQAAAVSARAAGACWQCCAEAGMRATDGVGMTPRLFQEVMHPECAKRIERGVR